MKKKERKIRDVVDEVLQKGGYTQVELGKRLGINQSRVSKMRAGPDWQEHWEVIQRLLTICEELEIDAGSVAPRT